MPTTSSSYSSQDASLPPTGRNPHGERIAKLEKGQIVIEDRLDKYDGIIDSLNKNMVTHDHAIVTFINEMKELKAKDVDLSSIVKKHDEELTENRFRWDERWKTIGLIGGIIVSGMLVYLGVLLSHIIH